MKPRRNPIILTAYLLMLTSCIGTDVVDDLATGSFTIEIESLPNTSLLVNEILQLTAKRITQDNQVIPTNQFIWTSDAPDIAEADGTGLVHALSPGQARITAAYADLISEPVLVTVVRNSEEVAKVLITTQPVTLQASETLQLEAEAQNIEGDVIETDEITWQSANTQVATISATGLVTAVSDGNTDITAMVAGVSSDPFEITVGSRTATRTGTLMGVGGYKASGKVTLSKNSQNQIELSTSADFEASLALGTFIYLSNSTSGGATFSNGLEVADISNNLKGAKTYNISAISSEVNLDTYQYVIILCKPAQVTFGSAELK